MKAMKRFRPIASMLAFAAAAGAVGLAHPAPVLAQAAAAEVPASRLAVFIRPGPAWERRASEVAVLVAHREIYRSLAERGAIAVSGPFEGEPVLGMALFAAAADETEIRRLLDADPAVAAGLLVNEYRRFTIHFGGLASRAAR